MKTITLALTTEQIATLSDNGHLNPDNLRKVLIYFIKDNMTENQQYWPVMRDYDHLDSKTFKHTVKVLNHTYDWLKLISEHDGVPITKLSNWIFEHYYPANRERLFYVDRG